MKGRVLILIAVVTYLAAVGCVMWPATDGRVSSDAQAAAPSGSPAPAPAKLGGLPYRGIVLQVQRIDDPAVYHKALDDIAGTGADTVSIVVDSRQENGASSMIFLDLRMTPAPDKLIGLVKYAKSRGLRVVMMPIVLLEKPRDNEWRGRIAPGSWEDWFESYRQIIRHYAGVAEQGGADVFSVGSELVSTERFADEWRRTIRDVRKIFHGQLTYSANWDHYQNIPFWDQLDLVGMNSYYKLGENRDVTVDEIVSRWRNIQKDLLAFEHRVHKPLLFMEVGWCSVANAAHEPWDYTQIAVAVDTDLQRKLYEGFFRAWYGVPELGGFMVWQWTPEQGGPRDRGYTPAGKPAEQVLRQWLAKPRWQVNP